MRGNCRDPTGIGADVAGHRPVPGSGTRSSRPRVPSEIPISADNYYLVEATAAAGLLPEAVTRVRRRISEQERSFNQDVTQFHAQLRCSATSAKIQLEALL